MVKFVNQLPATFARVAEKLKIDMKALTEIQTEMLKSYIRLTQSNINSLIKRDKQMARYFQDDLDKLQKDTGISDEMLYEHRLNVNK